MPHSEVYTSKTKMNLKGKVALITGGCQGIGEELAKAILARGGKVAILDINQDAGSQMVVEYANENLDSSLLFIHCDVSDKDMLKDSFKKANSYFGGIDIICNNAGIVGTGIDVEKTINVNLTAVINCTYEGIEYLRKDKGRNGGVIINVGSMAGIISAPHFPVYGASKSGVIHFTCALKGVYTAHGIRINSLCPAFVKTPVAERKLKLCSDLTKLYVKKAGILSVDEVVAGFLKILEDESLDGKIVSVTRQKGVSIIDFPRFTFQCRL